MRVVLYEVKKARTACKYHVMPFHENRECRKFSSLAFDKTGLTPKLVMLSLSSPCDIFSYKLR